MEVSALSKVEILTFGGNAGIVGTIPPEISQLSDTLNFWQTSGGFGGHVDSGAVRR